MSKAAYQRRGWRGLRIHQLIKPDLKFTVAVCVQFDDQPFGEMRHIALYAEMDDRRVEGIVTGSFKHASRRFAYRA